MVHESKQTMNESSQPLHTDFHLMLDKYVGVNSQNYLCNKETHAGNNYFTESEFVLHWIKTTKQLPVSIQNQKNEIPKEKDLTFSFISTYQNPADITVLWKSRIAVFGGMDQNDFSVITKGNLPDIMLERLAKYLSQLKSTAVVKVAPGYCNLYKKQVWSDI